MARADTLEILADIIDQLDPLAEVERGDALRSAHWNTVVTAVAALAKLVASREKTLADQLVGGYAPAGHDHRGEATLAWFEPDTRRLLETATGGSVEQRLGLQRIDKELSGIRGDIRDLRDDMEGLRRSLDQLRDADFARERSLGRVQNDVVALRGLEGGVDNLAQRLTGLDDGIAAVMTFREQLQDENGEPVDLGGLQDRVTDLEGLRAHLLTEDGEVVRIREITSTIARLEEELIARDEIDGLIVDRMTDAGLLADAGLLDGIRVQVEDALDPRLRAAEGGIAGLRGDLDTLGAAMTPVKEQLATIDERLAAQGVRLDGRLAAMAPRLDRAETRLSAAETELAAATEAMGRVDALGRSVTAMSARVDALDATAALASTNAAAIGTLRARTDDLEAATRDLPGLVSRVDTLERQTSMLDGLDTRVSALDARSAALDTRLDVTEAELDTLEGTGARLDVLENDGAALETWRRSADRRIAQLASGPGGAIEERLSAVEEGLADNSAAIKRLDQRVATQPVINRPVVGGGGIGGVIR